jgi:release factor glutamine methyltransferase
MTINQANQALTLVRHLAHKIHTQYDDPAQRHQVVWWLLEALTGKSKLQLLVDTHEIPEAIKLQLHELLHEHVAHNKPLQYLLKTVPFCDLNIAVRPPVLIPRPETEEWCSALIAQLHPVRNLPLRILDLCTGSGCIALSLAHALHNSQIVAVDIADEALALAQENATHNNITNISFIKSNLFAQLGNQTFDLIVANPPYIAHTAWQELEPSVKDWEDYFALVAENNGLAIIAQIIAQAPTYIRPNSALQNMPHLWIEIGYDQGPAVAQLMRTAQLDAVTVHKDFAKHDRLVSGCIIPERVARTAAQKIQHPE